MGMLFVVIELLSGCEMGWNKLGTRTDKYKRRLLAQVLFFY
jgi:hypothetical protein